MSWIALYGVAAVTVAVAAFLAPEWIREPGTPAPAYPGVIAVVTGLLWPVVVSGAAQGGLIVAIQSMVHHSRRPAGLLGPERVAGAMSLTDQSNIS